MLAMMKVVSDKQRKVSGFSGRFASNHGSRTSDASSVVATAEARIPVTEGRTAARTKRPRDYPNLIGRLARIMVTQHTIVEIFELRGSVASEQVSPFISIGAGRSGTTLLDYVLGEHPAIHSVGETSFLIYRLHQTLMEKEDYFRKVQVGRLAHFCDPDGRAKAWVEFAGDVVRAGNPERYGNWSALPRYDRLRERERERMLRDLGESFWRLMVPPALRTRRWMFREIWLGSGANKYNVDLLPKIFPSARFLQSVRHPFEYLRSNLNTNQRTDVTFEQAVFELEAWVGMVRHNRSVAPGAAYLEFRYEDLTSDGGITLDRIFDFLDLESHVHCHKALGVRILPSDGPDVFQNRRGELVDAVQGLREEMDRLDYSVDSLLNDRAFRSASSVSGRVH